MCYNPGEAQTETAVSQAVACDDHDFFFSLRAAFEEMVYRSPETMKEMNEVLERIVRKFSSSKKMLGLHNEGIPPQASPPGSAGLSSAATAGKVAAIVEDTASNYQEAVVATPTVHARATLADQPSVLPSTPELSPHGKASNKSSACGPPG